MENVNLNKSFGEELLVFGGELDVTGEPLDSKSFVRQQRDRMQQRNAEDMHLV